MFRRSNGRLTNKLTLLHPKDTIELPGDIHPAAVGTMYDRYVPQDNAVEVFFRILWRNKVYFFATWGLGLGCWNLAATLNSSWSTIEDLNLKVGMHKEQSLPRLTAEQTSLLFEAPRPASSFAHTRSNDSFDHINSQPAAASSKHLIISDDDSCTKIATSRYCPVGFATACVASETVAKEGARAHPSAPEGGEVIAPSQPSTLPKDVICDTLFETPIMRMDLWFTRWFNRMSLVCPRAWMAPEFVELRDSSRMGDTKLRGSGTRRVYQRGETPVGHWCVEEVSDTEILFRRPLPFAQGIRLCIKTNSDGGTVSSFSISTAAWESTVFSMKLFRNSQKFVTKLATAQTAGKMRTKPAYSE